MLILLLGVSLSGCGSALGGIEHYEHPPAPIVEEQDCLADGLRYSGLAPSPPGASAAASSAPAQGSVPAGFDAETVVRCSMDFNGIVDAQGRWSVVSEKHLTGNLDPLLEALRQPSERGGTMACTADMEILPELWLVDSSGSAMRPAWPTNACGKSKSGVAEALSELDVTTTIVHRVRLIEPRAAMDAGCSGSWGLPLKPAVGVPAVEAPPEGAADAGGGTTGSPGLLPEPAAVDEMRACHYAVDPADPVSGLFETVQMLAQDTAHAVLAAARSTAAAPQCSHAPSSFAILWPLRAGQPAGAPISVELDGCQRLIPADGQARLLPAETLATLTGSAAH